MNRLLGSKLSMSVANKKQLPCGASTVDVVTNRSDQNLSDSKSAHSSNSELSVDNGYQKYKKHVHYFLCIIILLWCGLKFLFLFSENQDKGGDIVDVRTWISYVTLIRYIGQVNTKSSANITHITYHTKSGNHSKPLFINITRRGDTPSMNVTLIHLKKTSAPEKLRIYNATKTKDEKLVCDESHESPHPCRVWPRNVELKCLLLFTKIPKCASSTIGGIARRIAEGKNDRSNIPKAFYQGVRSAPIRQTIHYNEKPNWFLRNPPQNCMVLANHFPYPRDIRWLRHWHENNKVSSFTFIRDPMERALSQFYHFRVSNTGYPHDDNHVRQYLKRFTGKTDFMLHYMDYRHADINYGRPGKIKDVLEQYNFIGLVERLDESLVVLKIILDLDFADILHVGASKSENHHPNGVIKYVKPIKTEAIIEYIHHDVETKPGSYDRQLWNAVNRSLDATIDAIGSNFDIELKIYKNLMKRINVRCANHVVFPKSVYANDDDDCYWHDNGCGRNCMREFTNSKEYHDIVSSEKPF